jgi:hypothetical protein
LPQQLGETILVTVHPEHVSPEVLAPVDIVIAVGHDPKRTLGSFAAAAGHSLEWPPDLSVTPGNAVVWSLADHERPHTMTPRRGRAERIRHHRKYAVGNLRWHSFYFKGPHAKHNLRAQNLMVFSQIAEGIDDETWLFHLRRGDYSRWFRDCIKDEALAEQAKQIEANVELTASQARGAICALVSSRYTLPE